MEPQTLITIFHGAVARDLLIYIVALVLGVLGAWATVLLWGGRGPLAAALVLTLGAGGLAYAAQGYRAAIPARVATDLATYAADPDGAAEGWAVKYGRSEAGARFARLAAIWSAIIVLSAGAMALFPRPVVQGVGSALILLAATTFVLDGFAFARDLRYAAEWRAP